MAEAKFIDARKMDLKEKRRVMLRRRSPVYRIKEIVSDVSLSTMDTVTQLCKNPACPGNQREALRVCHHPGCTQTNVNRPLLLCKECDNSIHQKPECSGHLVLDAPKRKSNHPMLTKFTSAPTFPTNRDSFQSETDEVAEVAEEKDEGIDEEDSGGAPVTNTGSNNNTPEKDETGSGEQEKKLKRKKVVKNKRRHTDGFRSQSVSDIYARSYNSRSEEDGFDESHRNSFDSCMVSEKGIPNGTESKRRSSTPINAFSSQYQNRRLSKTGINNEHFTLKFIQNGEEEIEIVAAMKSISLREAIQPILERRGMDINNVNVFVEASNTPLPLTCETFLLGGTTMNIREKDGDTDHLQVGTQSLSKATGSKLAGGKDQRAKNSKSGMLRRESVIGRAQSMLEPPTIIKQRRSSLQLPFQGLFPSPKLGDSSRSIDESTGSLRSRRGINLSIDDTQVMASLTASISPQGTLRENETRKGKQQSKLTTLFSPLNKDKEKQDQLSELLNGYSVKGFPPPPSLMQIGQQQIDETMFSVEADWRLIVQDSQKLTKRQQNQQEAIWELLQTELHYIQSLRVITDLFLCVLLNIQNELLLNEIETEKLFCNVSEIVTANCEFWQTYLVKVIENSRRTALPFNPSLMKDGFIKYHEQFQPYIGYCCRQKNCLDYSKTQYTENELFKTFVVWAEAQKQCNRLKLTDLLVKPMQRLTKYSLLLQAILRKTDDERQRKDLLEMIASVDRFVHHVNSTLRQQHEEEKLQAIVDKIESYDAIEAPNDECLKLIQPYNGNFNLTAPMPGCDNSLTRSLVMQSALKLKDYQSRMDVECLLFTDLFLVCKASKRMDKYKIVKPPMRVDRIIVHELKDKGSFLLIYVNEYHVPVSSFTFHADQMGIRVWVDHIRKAQIMYREARQSATTGESKPDFPGSEIVEEEVIGYTPLIMPDNPPMLHLTRCSSEETNIPNQGNESGSPINRSRSWNDMESGNYAGPVRQNAITSDPNLERSPPDNPPPSIVQYSQSDSMFNDRDSFSSDSLLQVPSMKMQPERTDSQGSLPDFVDENLKSKLYQRRTSRTEKRYYTADAIQEMQKNENKDTSIYKRLSWNFGNGDLSVERQGVLRNKTMSTDSIRSVHSSSGVSSTGSLHLSPEGDICEEIDELEKGGEVIVNHNNAIPLDINEDDLQDSLFPESKQSKSKSTSDICTLMQELNTNDIKDGISSVELPKTDDPKRKLTHSQILRMKKQLLLSSNIEASEV